MGQWRRQLRVQVRASSEELSALLSRMGDGARSGLSPEEALRFGALFRQASAHLQQLQRDPAEAEAAAVLRALVVQAHAKLYRPPRANLLHRLGCIYAYELPQLVRRTWRLHLAAGLLLLAGIVVGYALVADDPDRYFAIHDLAEGRSPAASAEQLKQTLLSGRDAGTGEHGVFASQLWVHNTQVSILVFCLGAFAAVPTVLLLLFNGLILGSMTQAFARAGLGVEWGAWVFGHGVTELGAVVVAAAAGLLLGRALLVPGERTRTNALIDAARGGAGLLYAVVPMLLVAALLEGFFRQSEASTAMRYGVGATTGGMWLVYFVLAGRGRGAAPVVDEPVGQEAA